MWLAGLLGLVGLGAATYVATPATEDDMDMPDTLTDDPGDRVDLLQDLTAEDSMIEDDTAEDMDASDQVEETTTIDDFDPDQDTLLFVWDDSEGADAAPEVAIETDPDDPSRLQVLLGDALIAKVSGKVSLAQADVALMPLSSAQALELVEA